MKQTAYGISLPSFLPTSKEPRRPQTHVSQIPCAPFPYPSGTWEHPVAYPISLKSASSYSACLSLVCNMKPRTRNEKRRGWVAKGIELALMQTGILSFTTRKLLFWIHTWHPMFVASCACQSRRAAFVSWEAVCLVYSIPYWLLGNVNPGINQLSDTMEKKYPRQTNLERFILPHNCKRFGP